jgi:signal transduction histidine kinase/CheY-like chemotaxis protein
MPQTIAILAPAGRDSAVIGDILRKASIDCIECASSDDLIADLDAGRAGVIVVTEEAFSRSALEKLIEWIVNQPPWSDLPILLLTKRNGNAVLQSNLAASLGNTTILERPFLPGTLVSAARSALRARTRQHEAEDYIAELAARERELSQERARLARSESRLREVNEKLGRGFAEALAEKKVLADIVEGTDSFVQVADLNYRWLAVNRAARDEFERIYGVRPEVGMSMLDALKHMPEHCVAVQAVWSRALAGEEFTETSEFGNPELDRRFYEMKFNALYNEHGERIGAYQFVYDVTERVCDQQRLADAQARMHEMAKLETLGQLTGGVAHDFNNLLTPIVGALDSLHRRFSDDPRARRLITGALEASERATTLVQRLLSFARRQHLEARAINVGELVQGIEDLVRRSIGPHVDVDVAIHDNLPPAKIDPNQLELAVLNLAVNASDAMSGGGTLGISVEGRELAEGEVGELAPGRYVRLAVADSGTGMDEATIQRAIEPFFTTKGPGEGTGLGLSMVHGLAAQSGGVLRLISNPGDGTTAEIWLPAIEGAADPLAAPEADVPAQPRSTAILLVDDEELVRRATAEMLREIGHEVLEASSAMNALKLLDERPDIEVLVTDYLMPGTRGSELIDQARRVRPDLKSVLITGYARLTADQPGVARLAKPFRASDLAREIARILSDGQVVDLDSRRRTR